MQGDGIECRWNLPCGSNPPSPITHDTNRAKNVTYEIKNVWRNNLSLKRNVKLIDNRKGYNH
jgi:hypothetical protein